MTPYTLTLPTEFPGKKIRKILKPHHTLVTETSESEPALILDTFDQELQNEGKFLLEKDKTILLIDTATGQATGQKGNAHLLCTHEIKDGEAKGALAKTVSELRAFLPIAVVSYYKQTRIMLDDEGKTVARLHCFVFSKKKQSYQLIISQPMRGYTEEHELLIDALNKTCVSEKSLYEALKIKGGSYCAKPNIALVADAPIKQTTREIITTFIEVARQNEVGIIDDYDTEFLHDYRVSLRKVRSVISLFKGVYSPNATIKLKEEFADLMQVTGRLRDLDVYLLDRQNYFNLVPASTHEGLNIMFDSFEKERTESHKMICKALKSKQYNKRIESLWNSIQNGEWKAGSLAESESHSFACAVILRRYKKVCKIARSIDEHTDDDVVHELRIHCKKLRYLMEFFTPLFSRRKLKSLIKSLKVLQDNLGRFNDYSVQQESLSVFLNDNPIKGADGIKVAESIGALTAMLNLLQQKERNLVMDNFARFDSVEIRTLFDNLFSTEG